MSASFLSFVFILAVAVLALFTLSRNPRRGSRDAFIRTDNFLSRAEREMMLGKLEEADALYNSALIYSRASGCGLFQAEAYYGIARIREMQGRYEAARDALQLALSNRDQWADEKPNFAALINNMLADVNRRLSK